MCVRPLRREVLALGICSRDFDLDDFVAFRAFSSCRKTPKKMWVGGWVSRCGGVMRESGP